MTSLSDIFSAVKENPDKQLDGGKEDFVFIFELKQKKNKSFFSMCPFYKHCVIVCVTGEIAGIVLSLLLLAFAGGFICAFIVVRRRQVPQT